MDRRTLNLGILTLGASVILPRVAYAAEVDVDAALAPRVLGEAKAPVTMVEYSSLTCPHCAAFHNDTLPTIKKEYIEAGKVKLEMRDFPLDQFALRAAAMARCAPEARYFALMDLLFKQQAKWSRAQNPIDELKKIGRFAGIAPEQADACMTDKTLLDGILEARLLAQRTHDIRSTPTFIIGNVKVSGNQSIEEFRSVFDGQLT